MTQYWLEPKVMYDTVLART